MNILEEDWILSIRRIPVDPRQIFQFAFVFVLLSLFIPWYLFLPGVREMAVGTAWLIGGAVQTFLLTLWLWFRDRRIWLEIGSSEVWFCSKGERVWGGNWASIRREPGLFRTYLTDSQGRRLNRDFLTSHFVRDDELIEHLHDLPSGPPPRRSIVVHRLSLVGIVISLGLIAAGTRWISPALRDGSLELDANGIAAIVAVIVGSLLGVTCGPAALFSYQTRYTGKVLDSKVAELKKPIPMEAGIRYAYENPAQLKDTKATRRAAHLMLSPYTTLGLVGIVAGILIPEVWPVSPTGLIVVLTCFVTAELWGRESQSWRDAAYDEFELQGNELFVYRGDDARRLLRTSKPTKPWSTVQSWGGWHEEYADEGGTYTLDRRYLVPVVSC